MTDPGIVERKHANVLTKLVEYVKSGGTLVVGGSFSTFVRPTDNDVFFKKAFGLNWKMGSYHRTTFSLNPARPERLIRGPILAQSYSMKTVHLKGISRDSVVYGPEDESWSEAPVVYTRVGQGYLGYIGDVNEEDASTNVILSMLGLPAQSTKVHAGGLRQASSSSRHHAYGDNEGKRDDAGQTIKASLATPSNASSPQVLLISFDYADSFNRIHAHFLAALRSRADVIQAQTSDTALQTLSRPKLAAVYVTDPGIVERKHAKVLTKLIEYVKSGGTLVVGGSFSTFVRPTDNDAFFKKAFGLNWKMGSYHRTTFSLNLARPERLLRGPSLAPSYSMKTVHLKGISRDSVVYGPTAESRTQSMVFAPSAVDLDEAPVVYTQVGQGYLGYIGDVNGEKASTNVILSMLGLPARSTKVPGGLRQPSSTTGEGTSRSTWRSDSKPGRGRGSSSHHHTQHDNKGKGVQAGQTIKGSLAPPRNVSMPLVLLLSFDYAESFNSIHKHFVTALRSRADVIQAETNDTALQILSRPNLTAVYVTDPGIVERKHAKALTKLAEHVNSGSTLVVGGSFSIVRPTDNHGFFKKAFALNWKAGSCHRATFSLNPAQPERLLQGPSLATSYSIKLSI